MKKRLSFLFVGVLVVGVFVACTKDVGSHSGHVHLNYIFKEGAQGAAFKFDNKSFSKETLVKGVENELYQAEMKVYQIKINQIRKILTEKIMDMDPKKKNMSYKEYTKKYIFNKIKISKKEINEFIKERKVPKKLLNPQMRKRIENYLVSQKKSFVLENWVNRKLKKKPIEVYFKKPERPVFNVTEGDSPVLGNSQAKVTIVEFSDFQCPFCAKGGDLVHKLLKKYKKKVKVVFKNFPLPFHKDAKRAAQAALCARKQKGDRGFWKFHDLMFKHQDKLSLEGLLKLSKKISLDQKKLENCIKNREYAAVVERDIDQGKKLGIRSTPVFFVNGKLINGVQSMEVFSEIIDHELE